MKVLWIVNIVFPEVNQRLGNKSGASQGGGWLIGAATALLTNDNIQLYIATVSNKVHNLTRIQGEHIEYFLLPLGKGNCNYNCEYEPFWRTIHDDIKPDIVHIHGTEYTHGLAYVQECGNSNVVVSIQGLKSVCANYYLAGLSKRDILRNITLHDIIKGGILHQKRAFSYSGGFERELISKVDHIIGRTTWDKAHVWEINCKAKYHFCNETLRTEFYSIDQWDYNNCIPYTIFVTQAGYPIKGFHQLLKAFNIVLRHYPDAQIRIAGQDISGGNIFYKLLHSSCYWRIIKKMIHQNNLKEKIHFLGILDAAEIKKELLKCHLFISPSSIENSPNSVGEAQILGTPIIASYVGGVPDMMEGDESHMYRFEEVEMLAYLICQLFEHPQANTLKSKAQRRHDPQNNMNALLKIYNFIIDEDKK